jgi:pimeloyl-ACP methyl ester carboxylesterase
MAQTGGLAWQESGSGPVVLLLHAGITDRRMWQPQIGPLSESHRVIWYDARGFGESDPIAEPYRPYDDAVAILDAAGVDRAVVVGSSMGGATAIDMAIARPDRVAALVAVGIGPGGRTPDDDLRAQWDAVGAAYEAGEIERAIDLDTQMWIDRGPLYDQVRAWNAAIFARDQDASHELELELDPPAVGRLDEITCPVLAVVGDGDQPFMVEGARLLAEGVRDGHLAVLHGVRHLPSLERPDEFSALLLDFLAG